MNGSYQFANYQDRAFNPADPRSYPQRLTIRVPGPLTYELVMHVYEIFAQDKWQLKPGMTLSAGLRYDPLPAGTYNAFPAAGAFVMKDVVTKGGRNGARGPGFVQLDLRAGYKIRFGERTLDAFVDVFNVTNRANFSNPASGNRRVQADFLRLSALVGGTGFPRQAQLGLRLGF